MLYEIGRSKYIKVGGYYKEVSVSLNEDGTYSIIPTGKKIEVSSSVKAEPFDIKNVKKSIDHLSEKAFEERRSEKKTKREYR